LFPEAHSEWLDRFTILGGIPRDVLGDTTKPPIAILEAACDNSELEDFRFKLKILLEKELRCLGVLITYQVNCPPWLNSVKKAEFSSYHNA
jgi:hypothetical protein